MASNSSGSWGNRLRENLGYEVAAEQMESSSASRDQANVPDGKGGTDPDQTMSLKKQLVNGDPKSNDNKAVLHSLFSDAADSWIQGQTAPADEGKRDVPALQPSSFEESSHDYEADEDNDSDTSCDTPTKSHSKTISVSLDVVNSLASNVSMASVEDRRLSSDRKSFETNTSLGTSSSASFGSMDSLEVEMAAELHASWTTVKSESQSSSSFCSLGGSNDVYVRDSQYCWLPATVLEYQKEGALVSIKLPEAWVESTYQKDKKAALMTKPGDIHPSMKKMSSSELDILVSEYEVPANSLRQVFYKDYEHEDLPKQNTQASGKRNMEDLFHQHAPAILYNLKERHLQEKPYTRVGDILVALNPFVWIDDLYLPETRDLYSRHLIWNGALGFEPHAYEVSALSYRGLARTNQDQTILVTGESGAGKTETVKLLLDHLASVQLTRPGVGSNHCPSKDIVDRVIKSSPVFEAFGNAKTVRNTNSSRFGKFIQLQFRVEPMAIAKMGGRDVPYADMVGSKVSTYLLEKNRVVSHADGERTFHIFYQLLAAPQRFKEELWPFFGNCNAESFKYTAGKVVGHQDDAELWEETKNALGVFTLDGDSLNVLMQALGVVLQIGNLIFEEDSTSEHQHSTLISSKDELERLSSMIGIDEVELHKTMTSRTLKTPGSDTISVNLTHESAKQAADAIAKELYHRVFLFIVNLVSTSLGIKEEESQGIDLFDFKLIDNTPTLHLFEGRHGLIVTLNEECLLPKGNDESFVYKVKQRNTGSNKMLTRKLDLPTEFGVVHFAGSVQYTAGSFVQANTDKLPESLIQCLARSTNTLIKDEFLKILASREVHGEGSKASNKKKNADNKTVLHKFQRQLKSLIVAMDGTKTRYIRCIKANAQMVPKITDHVSTIKQLECSGLMTALTISKESFPQKLTYDFIVSRYSCLINDSRLTKDVAGMEKQEKVRYVLVKWLKPMSTKNRDGTRTMPFACGKTKVFFKPGAQDRLEHLRRQFYERSSCTIQSWFRMMSAMKLLVLRKKSVLRIQSFCRMALAKARFEKQRLASTLISACMRCRWALLAFRMKRGQGIKIQSAMRRWGKEKEFNSMKANAVLIQAIIRMTIVRLESRRLNVAAKKIQSYRRSYSCRCSFQEYVARVIVVQRTWKRHRRSGRMLSELPPQEDLTAHLDISTNDEDDDDATDIDDNSDVVSSSYSTLNSFNILSSHPMTSDQRSQESRSGAKVAPFVHIEMAEALQKLKESEEREQKRLEEMEQMQSIFKSRVADLAKANNSLVKEVFKLRQECNKTNKQKRMDALQSNSVLQLAVEDKEQMRRNCEKRIQSMERRLFENQERQAEERMLKSRDIDALEENYSENVAKLRDELRKTQDSHQNYLAKLMAVLETTQSMREKETAKISAELRAIKKEKDNQILMLQQELKAARAAKGIIISSEEAKPLIDSPRMKKELLSDADGIAKCSQKFNDTVEKLTNLITSSHALPPVVGPHNMAEVMEEQENAQRMMEMVGVLIDLYSVGEARQTSSNERALAAVNDYIALSEPDEAIRLLRERLAQVELENGNLKQELHVKDHCRRCAVRDEAARRRISRSDH
ncbi:MAG: hypothetical protein SGILL_001080 [Bacillariaceae sp.]